ncbi:aspartic peptidase domain-containing protein [Suillus spraguei]|nr:aspartic peptidase domain-containing protein [Suillus spraguei]
MCLAASLSILSLALSITGSPVEVRNSLVTIPLTRRLNFSNGTIDFLQHDKARLAAFRGYNMHDRRADNSIPVKTIGIGNPPQPTAWFLDTGSSITWVGTGKSYDTGTQSSFLGTIFYDTVTLGGGVTVTGFPLGVAFIWNGFDSGEDDLEGTIPTFTDYLYKQRKIGRHPALRNQTAKSETLTFGGTDRTNPITAMPPASRFWILGFTAGIVDTGTTFLHIASDAYISYKAATGSTYDPPTGLLRITTRRYSALQNLEFHIEGVPNVSLTPNAQIWPRSLNYKLDGGAPRAIYLIVIDSGMPSGRGDDFTVGHTFIQRFYTVFDRDNSLVAITN